jgi:hypothetical protein
MPYSDFDVVTGPSMQQPRPQAPPAEQTNQLPEPVTEPPRAIAHARHQAEGSR